MAIIPFTGRKLVKKGFNCLAVGVLKFDDRGVATRSYCNRPDKGRKDSAMLTQDPIKLSLVPVFPGRLARLSLVLALVVPCGATVASAQVPFILDFPRHSAAMREVQPYWMPGVVTATARITEAFRSEAVRSILPTGKTQMNAGNAKGFRLTLSRRIELDASLPGYIFNNDPKLNDAFSDAYVATKYRLFSGNERHGNYALTAMVRQNFPTGQYKNGAVSETQTYQLLGGKGLGNWSIQTAAGYTQPGAKGLATIGRPVTFNNNLAWHVRRSLWIEVEDNPTWFHGGKNDGKMMNFVTPVVGLARIHPKSWGEQSVKCFTIVAGMQVATSTFRTSNHNLIVDFRTHF